MQPNFLTTRWSVVLQASGEDSPLQREALAKLLQDNWFPLYVFVRRSGKSAEEAEDLIQGFFTKLLEKKMLASVEGASRGRFRNFLLVCLKNFIRDQWKKSSATKRGGGQCPVSIDYREADRRMKLEPFHEQTPESAFDKAWGLEVVQRSLQEVQANWSNSGNAEMFEVLKAHLLPEDQVPSYTDTAAILKLNLSTLKAKIHRLRAEFRRVLCAQIADALGKHDVLEDEINQLFSAICSQPK